MSTLIRGVRSELARWSWRSPVVLIFVPLAIGIPILINLVIALAARGDLIANTGGVETDNAGYWAIVFTSLIMMLAAVSATCGEYRNRTIDKYLTIAPRRWGLPAAKLVTYGCLAIMVALVTIVVLLWLFPLIFPDVWGGVSIGSGDGIRLIIGVPVLGFFICALGIGLSLLIRRSGIVIMAILLWKYGVELAFTFVPGGFGDWLQRWSPFRNGELGAGQGATSTPTPFGGDTGSLIYFGVLCLLIFAFGVVKLYRSDIED